MIGKVKWFSQDRQFGFITHNGLEYFVHGNQIKSGQDLLLKDQQVSFNLKPAKKGQQAVDVKVIEVNGNV